MSVVAMIEQELERAKADCDFLDVTPVELARLNGLNFQTIYNVWQGRTKPKPETVDAIISAFPAVIRSRAEARRAALAEAGLEDRAPRDLEERLLELLGYIPAEVAGEGGGI